MSTDPLNWFHAEREAARAADDPMAHLCTVANVDADRQPQVRTLVLREIDGQLAVFVNASSPKWPHIQERFAFCTYWPSLSLQYRFDVVASPLDPAVLAASWVLRPDAPKRMDWLYELHDTQSSHIESRQHLLDVLGGLSVDEPLSTPPNARGLLLAPMQIERLDLTQDNGVHDRQRFDLVDGIWQQRTLIP